MEQKFSEHFLKKIKPLLKKSDKKQIAVLCTGCYCPAHEGHVSMMEIARQKVEQKNEFSIGIFSPASDQYMSQKIKTQQMDINPRIDHLQNLIKMNNENNDKYIVDDFEGKYHRFIDYPEICKLYKQSFNQDENDIKLAYCVGSDLLKYNIHKCFPSFADYLIIIERDQYKIPKDIQETDRLLIIKGTETSGITSTQIRQENRSKNQKYPQLITQNPQNQNSFQNSYF